MNTSFFIPLFCKILPLYMNIGLGYIATKVLDAHRDTIARIMFFLINPIIIFNGVLNVDINTSTMSLPILTFFISSFLCLLFYRLSENMWDDSSKNLVAYSAGSGNVGYFGLPVAILLFSDRSEGIYILCLLGIALYEGSVGYYVLARGSHPVSDCLKKILQLPSIYAFIAGLFINWLDVPIPKSFVEFMVHIKGTYAVLGMMIIGMGLAGLHHIKMDGKFIGMTFLAKFLGWPLVVLAVNLIDTLFFGFYTPQIHKALILISIVPVAVNTVIVASIMKSQPEKAASAVLFSTIFALIYVPIMVGLFIAN